MASPAANDAAMPAPMSLAGVSPTAAPDLWAASLALRDAPKRPHVMHQTWSQLLFLHWAWDADAIQKTLPPGLTVDTYDGKAWLGVVPFYMQRIRPRFLPAVPWLSDFLELNVRTYVKDARGRPGVWFYSLDCNQPVAVWTARTFFHLPYHHARMKAETGAGGEIRYRSQRRGTSQTATFRYTLSSEHALAQVGTLEFFLVERYLLYAQTPRGLRSGQVHHVPYPVSQVQLDAWDAGVLELNGFPLPARPPDHVCGSGGVGVRIYPLTP